MTEQLHIVVRRGTFDRLKERKESLHLTWDEFLLRVLDPCISPISDDKEKILSQLNAKELEIRVLVDRIAELEDELEDIKGDRDHPRMTEGGYE